MCAYDLDRLRRYVLSDAFKTAYDLEDSFYATVAKEDIALMQFGIRLLKQVLFGDKTIAEKQGAAEKRLEERKEILEQRRMAEAEFYQQKKEQEMKDAMS
jgi:hypothetical protein